MRVTVNALKDVSRQDKGLKALPERAFQLGLEVVEIGSIHVMTDLPVVVVLQPRVLASDVTARDFRQTSFNQLPVACEELNVLPVVVHLRLERPKVVNKAETGVVRFQQMRHIFSFVRSAVTFPPEGLVIREPFHDSFFDDDSGVDGFAVFHLIGTYQSRPEDGSLKFFSDVDVADCKRAP